MFKNVFGNRWFPNQNAPQNLENNPDGMAVGWTEVSWLGNFAGASPMEAGVNYMNKAGVRNDNDGDLISEKNPNPDASNNDVMFGTINTDIVGIHHYNGKVNPGEMVTLDRKPDNQHDKNVIRVFNMNSEQVGHIKRELAKPLSFILDNKLARVTGRAVPITCGPKHLAKYKIPVEIRLWGNEEKKTEALSELKSVGFTFQRSSDAYSGNSFQDYFNALSSQTPGSQAPGSQAPGSQAPGSQAPGSSHAPSNQTPAGSQAPSNQAPAGSQAPSNQAAAGSHAPSNQAPAGSQAPSNQAPAGSHAPSNQTPAGSQAPSNQTPGSQAPGSQAPGSSQAPSNQAPAGSHAPSNQTPAGSQAPSNQTPAGSQAPSNQTPAGSQAPSNQAPAGSQAPSNQAPAGSQAPSNQAPAGSQAPSNQTPAGSQAPSNQTPAGSQAPSNQAPAGSQAPGSQAPAGSQDPSNQAPAGSQAPSNQAPAGSQAPSNQAPAGSQAPSNQAPAGSHAPSNQAPAGSHAPGSQAPVNQAPVNQAPGSQAPVNQAPGSQAPGSQAPIDQAPVDQAPVGQAPGSQAPGSQAPVGQAPVNQAPVGQAPVDQAPVGQAPVNQAPVGQAPIGANYTIDVGDDDDDDLMMSMIDLTQDGSSNDVIFGRIRGDIVGIQHYKGTVNPGEMVTLQREPNNQHDKNAIRVVNMNSEQVGHIKRELAKPLSFILDNKFARVEGVVPSGNNNVYKMPIEITLRGENAKKNEALSVLRSYSFTPRDSSGGASSSQASGSQAGLDYSHVVSNRVFISPSEVKNEMDRLFDCLEEGDKTTMTEPTQAIRTPLYPHQKQALNWMICKENNEALPPFWEKRGQRYFNSLTKFATSHKPATVHGGILADDMGLGKTLEVISLILTNFHDGQPLAVPVAGRKRFEQQSNSKTYTYKKKSGNKPSTESNQSEWDKFNNCLADAENYIEDSDEEQKRKAAKTLKIFQSRIPKIVMKPFGSSSESEHRKKSKSVLKNPSRSFIDDDDDDDDDDIVKSARPKKRSGKRTIIESDEDSNSAQYIDLTSPSPKHNNLVTTDNDLVATDNDPVSINNGLVATDNDKVATDNGLVATDNGLVATENNLVATDNSPVATDNGLAGTENDLVATDNSSVATDNGLDGTENDLVATDNSPVATDNGLAGTENDLVATDNGLVATDNGLVATDNGLVATDNDKVTTDNGLVATNNGLAGTENDLVATDNGLAGTENDLVATDNGLVATDNGLVATDNGLVATDNDKVATDNGLVATDNDKVATDNGLVATDNNLVATDNSLTATDNVKVQTASDIWFELFNSDTSSNSDDVALKSNSSEIASIVPESKDLEPKSKYPDTIHISDDSNESSLKLESRSVIPANNDKVATDNDKVATDNNLVATDNDKIATDNSLVATDNNLVVNDNDKVATDNNLVATDNYKVATDNNLVTAKNDKVATDNGYIKSADDIWLDLFNSDSSSNSDLEPQLKDPELKSNDLDLKSNDLDLKSNNPEVIYISEDSNESKTLPPSLYSRKVKKNRKKPTRYVDINSDDSDTEIKPPAKRARHNSIPKPISVPVQEPIPSANKRSNAPSSQGIIPPSSVSQNQLQPCQSASSKSRSNIASTSQIHNSVTVPKPKGKGKGKGKGKKRKLKEDGAPALLSLPADINDENHPPSRSQDDDDDDDDDDDEDDDWLPDLDMEIPFNCNKAVMGHCDSTTGRTKSDKPRTTLIVCPLSVMNNWESQLEEHVRENVQLKMYTYYGNARTTDCKFLESQDVVITTYGVVSSDFKRSSINPLGQVHWLRIVIDEGHYIRNSDTVSAMAIIELKADRRWVLTGTPIQNYLKDLHSLVQFLNIVPLTEKFWWEKTIECPVALGDYSRLQALMTNIGMRRTKNQQVNGKPLVELPARNVFIETIKFSDEERQVYSDMEKEGKLIIRKYFEQGTLLKQYLFVLVILLRLRQLCCHPFLCSNTLLHVPRAMELLGFNKDVDNQQQDGATNVIDDETKKNLIEALTAILVSDYECPICFTESLERPVITLCAHVYCRACIESVIQKTNTQTAPCPMCRGELKSDKLIEIPEKELQKSETPIVTDKNWQSSSKVDALMKALVQQRSDDPTVKSIIVSQFTSLLTLIEVPLKLNKFKFARLDGTMTNKKRIDNIEEFMDPSPDSPTIFLLSLKAGGVGLNLTAANRVFLMDPAWNPAAEEQCFDRCHRLGQTRDVNITKFVIEDSVEERMLVLQERKRKLMNEAFGKKKTPDESRNDTMNQIRTLLNL